MFARLLGAILATGLLASVAKAHDRAGMDDRDRCMLRVGPDVMQFTLYQLQRAPTGVCKDIPALGPAVIVLDYVDPELRGMTTDVRIVKDAAGDASLAGMLSEARVAPEALDPITEKHLPTNLYPTGIIKFEHTFTSAGGYHGIVTVKNDHGQIYVSQFPFSVGQTDKRTLLAYGLFAAPIVAGFLFYWRKFGRKHKGDAPTRAA